MESTIQETPIYGIVIILVELSKATTATAISTTVNVFGTLIKITHTVVF